MRLMIGLLAAACSFAAHGQQPEQRAEEHDRSHAVAMSKRWGVSVDEALAWHQLFRAKTTYCASYPASDICRTLSAATDERFKAYEARASATAR